MALFGPNIDKLKARGDVDALVKALWYREGEIRDTAGRALAELDLRGVDALLAVLRELADPTDRGDADRHAYFAVVRGLSAVKAPEAIDRLMAVASAEEEHYFVRKQVVKVLGEIGDSRSAETLAALALRKESGSLGFDAAVTLGELGGNVALEALIAGLGSDSEQTRVASYVALKRQGIDDGEQLSSEDQGSMEAVYASLWRDLVHGVDPGIFPLARPWKIQENARAKGAPDHVIRLLQGLPDRSFGDLTEVFEALVASRVSGPVRH